jgi:Fe-S-cluster-containing dehydrogenase component/CRP-like cAMP-binding protein
MTVEMVGIHRPQRWDVPLDPEMTDADVDRILTCPPFHQIDPARFPAALPLRGILRYDARHHRCQKGDILVRAGDYLSSAFYILAGTCRLELDPPGERLTEQVLGRGPQHRKNLWEVLSQLWGRHRWPEVRDPATYVFDERVARRGFNKETRIYLQDVQAVLDKHRTAQLGAGQSFGETSALSRTPREFTVFADSDAEIVEVRWQGLRDLIRRDAALRRHAEQTFRERALPAFLANTPLFADLPAGDREQVGKEATFESFGSYEKIVTFREIAYENFAARLAREPIIAAEGDYVNGLVMIRNGLVRVSKQHHNGQRTVSYLTPGQSYGFDEMAANWQRDEPLLMRHTLRAVGYVNVVMVPTPTIERYIRPRLPRPRVSLPVVPPAPADEESLEAGPTVKANTDLLEYMVENRFINGTASMVIDLDRCTRCDDCVRACATAHDNNPRFLRHGPTYGHHMVANACMHCQDPLCMIECPTGAIHRDLEQGVVVINDGTCIGCGACAHNCPYDAIRLVEVRDAHGHFLVDKDTNTPIAKATKCDLCLEQWGGPACQRACPHDALRRVDMRNWTAFERWVNR